MLLGIGMNLSSRVADLPASDRLDAHLPPARDRARRRARARRSSVLLARAAADRRPLRRRRAARRRRACARARRARGRSVELRLASGEVVRGTAAGIGDDGCLLVRSGGEVTAYASGEVARLT